MYDAKPENEKATERAWKMLTKLERGDLLSHEDAELALGAERPSDRYYALMDKLKRRMEDERGISLIAIPMVGYQLATAKDQLGLGRHRVVRAARQIRKGAKSVGSLPEAECNFTELRAKQAMEEKLALMERGARQEAQRIAFLMRPRDARPRIAQEDGEEQGATA